MELQLCTMRDLGLAVGDTFAVLTDKLGQPVQFVHRVDRNTFNVVTVMVGGASKTIPAQANHAVPDAQFIAMVSREIGLSPEESEAGVLRLMNRCEGHRRKRLWRLHRLKFKQPELSWTAGEGVVIVDTLIFEAAWAHDDDYYVGKGGHGSKSAKPAKYRRFSEWLESTGGRKPIEMPEVSLGRGRYNGVPQFTNGRHRFAVLRDMGYEKLPISVDVYSQSAMQQLYGVK
jgi:hypothetical protein